MRLESPDITPGNEQTVPAVETVAVKKKKGLLGFLKEKLTSPREGVTPAWLQEELSAKQVDDPQWEKPAQQPKPVAEKATAEVKAPKAHKPDWLDDELKAHYPDVVEEGWGVNTKAPRVPKSSPATPPLSEAAKANWLDEEVAAQHADTVEDGWGVKKKTPEAPVAPKATEPAETKSEATAELKKEDEAASAEASTETKAQTESEAQPTAKQEEEASKQAPKEKKEQASQPEVSTESKKGKKPISFDKPGMFEKLVETTKGKLLDLLYDHGGPKARNFLDAREVEKGLKDTEIYDSREGHRRKLSELSQEILATDNDIAKVDSDINREKAALKDAEEVKKLQYSLANGVESIQQKADAVYEQTLRAVNAKLADCEARKAAYLIQWRSLDARREIAKEALRSDEEQLRKVVENNIASQKEVSRYAEVDAEAQKLEAEIAQRNKESSDLNAKIAAYRASIKRGGFDEAMKGNLRTELEMYEEQADKIGQLLLDVQNSRAQVVAAIRVMDGRFGAMRQGLRNLGVLSPEQVKPVEQAPAQQEKKQATTTASTNNAYTSGQGLGTSNASAENVEMKKNPQYESAKKALSLKLAGLKRGGKLTPNDLSAFVAQSARLAAQSPKIKPERMPFIKQQGEKLRKYKLDTPADRQKAFAAMQLVVNSL